MAAASQDFPTNFQAAFPSNCHVTETLAATSAVTHASSAALSELETSFTGHDVTSGGTLPVDFSVSIVGSGHAQDEGLFLLDQIPTFETFERLSSTQPAPGQ